MGVFAATGTTAWLFGFQVTGMYAFGAALIILGVALYTLRKSNSS